MRVPLKGIMRVSSKGNYEGSSKGIMRVPLKGICEGSSKGDYEVPLKRSIRLL